MADDASEPRILTRAESEIMSVLWSRGAATVHDVVAALPRDAAYTSVLTMLRILEKKGYLTREPEPGGGRAHVYRPRVAATKARRQHVRDLIDRLFGGRSEELMVGLLEDEALSRGELEQMRGLIESRLGHAAPAPTETPPAETEPEDRGARAARSAAGRVVQNVVVQKVTQQKKGKKNVR
jgi:BlaI family penicillinase repressor